MDDPQEVLHTRFFELASRFSLPQGVVESWDPDKLDEKCGVLSHGEQCAVMFLLNVWNPRHPWKSGKFDAIDAISVWDDRNREAFLSWASDPFWP